MPPRPHPRATARKPPAATPPPRRNSCHHLLFGPEREKPALRVLLGHRQDAENPRAIAQPLPRFGALRAALRRGAHGDAETGPRHAHPLALGLTAPARTHLRPERAAHLPYLIEPARPVGAARRRLQHEGPVEPHRHHRAPPPSRRTVR